MLTSNVAKPHYGMLYPVINLPNPKKNYLFVEPYDFLARMNYQSKLGANFHTWTLSSHINFFMALSGSM